MSVDSASQAVSSAGITMFGISLAKLWLVVGPILGAAVGWFSKRHEIKKLKTENMKLTAELYKSKNEIENNFRTANEKAAEHVQNLCDLLKLSDKEPDYERVEVSMNSNRELFCNVMANGVLHHFRQLIETQSLIFSDKKKYLESYVLPELEKFCEWIQIINHPVLLKYIGSMESEIYSDRPKREIFKVSAHYFLECEEILDNAKGDKSKILSQLEIIKLKMCGI